MTETGILSTGGILFMGAYLLSMVVIGYYGMKAKEEESMADFYLAGRNMGFFVLLLTLYATQYSGNTLIGFAGNAYREGYRFLGSISFMMAVVGAYFIYAPKLFRLSRARNYITPGDYFQDRFNSRILTLIVSVIFIIALGNYILSNLKAVGYIVEGTTGGAVSFATGIIGLTVVMLIYESLGGMRSVAWTDAIQGVLLLLGVIAIFAAIQYQYGGITVAADMLRETRPDLWQPPTTDQMMKWFSSLVLFFFGVAVYPHAIQRIYAAKNEMVLKRSLQVMLFMPIFTTFFMVVVGVVGASQFPGLSKGESEGIVLLLLNDLAGNLPSIEWLIILFISAAVAAIMSTADSALLSISSIFIEDIYKPLRPNTPQEKLVWYGKIFSWGSMGFLALLAIELPQTIWKLIEIKLEILIQTAPAIFLGLHSKKLRTFSVLSGLLVGLLVAVALWLIGIKPLNVHAGVWGLLANFLTIGFTHFFWKK